MTNDERRPIVNNIIRHSENVNKFPTTFVNRNYWMTLPDAQLKQVLEKWRKLDENKS